MSLNQVRHRSICMPTKKSAAGECGLEVFEPDQKTIREIVFAANGKIQKNRILPCEIGMWRVNTIDPRETATGDLRLHPNEEGQFPIQPDVLCPRGQPK